MDNLSIELVAFGGAVKALERGVITGYLVTFGSPAEADLSKRRDFFTSRTEYDLEGCGYKSRFLYDHGLDPSVGRRRLARAELGRDGAGIWLKAQLALRDEYEAAIYQLARMGKLGLSSGTAPHLVERKAIDYNGERVHEILSWPLGLDASCTPRPADPRIVVEAKSFLGITAATLEEWLRDSSVKAAVDAIRQSAGAGRTFYSFSAFSAESRREEEPEAKGISMVRSLAWLQNLALRQQALLVDFWPYDTHPDLRYAGSGGYADAGGSEAWERGVNWEDETKGRYGDSSCGCGAGESGAGASAEGGLASDVPAEGEPRPTSIVPPDTIGRDARMQGRPAERRLLLRDIADGYAGRLAVARIDLGKSPEIGHHYNVYDSATILLVSGRVSARTDGLYALETMLANLETLLGASSAVGVASSASADMGRTTQQERKTIGGLEDEGTSPFTPGSRELLSRTACGDVPLPDGMPAYTWPEWTLLKRGEDGGRTVGFVGDQANLPGRNPYYRSDLLPENWGDLALTFAQPKIDRLARSGADGGTYYGVGYEEFITAVRMLYLCARADLMREARQRVRSGSNDDSAKRPKTGFSR